MADDPDLSNISKNFQQMSINTDDINILLMGETGVGKSTFINAFANYMEYDKFSVAEKNVVRCLIPSAFTVTDENMQERKIQIGKDKNENEEVGESATQGARSYVFPLPKYGKRVRLIDTPGVGDTRGIDQDSSNFENILSYIGNMEYLHAICFLLKPNNSRMTVYFHYCIKQLLSRLEKSASKNIIFLFTNARSTFYRPGDTAPALKAILEQIEKKAPHVTIKFTAENVFCLDNEAFRFMVSCKEGIHFTAKDKESFARSWEHSVAECWRMLDYITGADKRAEKLIPHKVQDTISVNHARRVIIQLSQPLADIAELINDNINMLQRHNVQLAKENQSMAELKKRMYVPVVNLRHKELSQPTTVCTNAACSEIYTVAGKKKYHYKQRCHDPCYLQNVPAEIIGSPELVNCYAIDRSTKKCRECSCDFSSHMHIYYITETFEDKITDTGIQSQVTDRETAVSAAQKLIKEIEERKKGYEKEKETITKNMAKFAHFLQNNAIAPYNDAYKTYIEYLIDRENSFGPDADTQLIVYYKELLKRYEEEKKILDDALKISSGATNTGTKSIIVKAGDILQSVKNLFLLPFTGKKIKELHEQQQKVMKVEYESNTEVVLDTRNVNPSISGATKRKPWANRRMSSDDLDDIPDEMKDKFRDMMDTFPEMRDFLSSKYRLQSEDDDKQTGNKQQNQGQKKFGNKGQKKNNNKGSQNRKPENYKQQQAQNQKKNSNANQGQGYFNQVPNNHNQNQGPYNQRNQNQRTYNQGQTPYNQGQGSYNQLPGGPWQGPYDQRPNGPLQWQGPHDQRPGGSYNQGQGPYNQHQNSYNQGQTPHDQKGFNQRQEPHNQQNVPYNQRQDPYNQRQGPYNPNQGDWQKPGSYNRNPIPPLMQGQGPYGQGFQDQNSYNEQSQGFRNQNQRQGPPNNQGQYPGPYDQGHNNQNRGLPNNSHQSTYQDRNQNRRPSTSSSQGGPNYQRQDSNNQNQGRNQGQGTYDRPNIDGSAPFQSQNRRSDYDRPSGIYQPESNEKPLLDDCDDDDDDNNDMDFETFMNKYGMEEGNNVQKGENNRSRGRGGGRGRGRRNRGGSNRDDADSDSGRSCSSRGTNRSRRGRNRNANADSGQGQGRMEREQPRTDNFSFDFMRDVF